MDSGGVSPRSHGALLGNGSSLDEPTGAWHIVLAKKNRFLFFGRYQKDRIAATKTFCPKLKKEASGDEEERKQGKKS
jgi:hypothetical protein